MNSKPIIINGQPVEPVKKVKLPKGMRIADVVPPYDPPLKPEESK